MAPTTPYDLPVGGLLRISFQRCPVPSAGYVEAPRSSWGALPVGEDHEGRPIVPLYDDETMWLGLEPIRASVPVILRISVETSSGLILNALTGATPPLPTHEVGMVLQAMSSLEGIARAGGGWWPFARAARGGSPSVTELRLTAVPSRRRTPRPKAKLTLPLHAAEGRPRTDSPFRITLARMDPRQWEMDRGITVQVQLVAPRTYMSSTGQPPPEPLDPESTYGGWRLP